MCVPDKCFKLIKNTFKYYKMHHIKYYKKAPYNSKSVWLTFFCVTQKKIILKDTGNQTTIETFIKISRV